jgi:hypothetical protein
MSPALKALAREASQALVRLDRGRLEALAEYCQALKPEAVDAREAREAIAELALLGRVLEATRANAEVMHRLRMLRADRIEYTERLARGCAAESDYGNH